MANKIFPTFAPPMRIRRARRNLSICLKMDCLTPHPASCFAFWIPPNCIPSSSSLTRLALCAALLCAGGANAFSDESKLWVFWDTVSPDGEYALTCSAVAAATAGPDTISNYVIETASTKIVAKLPEGQFWREHQTGEEPNHESMKVAWSDDSRSMLVIYDSRFETGAVYLVNVSSQKRSIRSPGVLGALFSVSLKSLQSRRWFTRLFFGLGCDSDSSTSGHCYTRENCSGRF